VWFRLLDVAIKSKAFTFGTLLSLYLLGSALGCLLIAPRVGRLRHPLRVFLLLQALLIAYAVAAITALVLLPPDLPGYGWFYYHWSRGGIRFDWQTILRLYLALPLVLFGLPTVLMGAAFPVLQRAVQDDPRTSGRKVGLLQAANIAGCTAGSLAVGLVALGLVGSTGVLRLLALLGLGFAVLGLRTGGSRTRFATLAVALALLVVLVPDQRRLWQRLHGTDHRALIGEDATGVAALVPRDDNWIVCVDGKSHSWLPFGGIHTRLGLLPAVLHPAPEDVAIIGLGSGDTAWAAAVRKETRSLTVFEISAPQPRLLRTVLGLSSLPQLQSLLDDPRLQIQLADGRNALLQGDRKFDVIEADALWPDVAYSGNLYSVEFFSLCARRLKPGGLVCSWAPTGRVYESFIAAFPYIVGPADHTVLVGSNEPIDLDFAAWSAHVLAPEVAARLGSAEVKAMSGLLKKLQPLNRKGRRPWLRRANHDLFPRDEFSAP
jgi:spermidine synthase